MQTLQAYKSSIFCSPIEIKSRAIQYLSLLKQVQYTDLTALEQYKSMASKDKDQQPKKKKPIQHLIGGGIAGFVESSVCHPLDTIKTRMQLRRQTTATKEVVKRMEGKALGSMRDASGKMEGKALGSMRDASVKEIVHVKPNLDGIKSANVGGATKPFHDVGWKQRVPSAALSSAAATMSTASKAAVETTAPPVVATLGPFGTARRIVTREGPLALYKGLTAVYTGIIPKMAIRFVSFEWYRDNLNRWYNHYSELPSSSAPPSSVTFTAGLFSGLTEAVAIVTPAEVCKIRMQGQ